MFDATSEPSDAAVLLTNSDFQSIAVVQLHNGPSGCYLEMLTSLTKNALHSSVYWNSRQRNARALLRSPNYVVLQYSGNLMPWCYDAYYVLAHDNLLYMLQMDIYTISFFFYSPKTNLLWKSQRHQSMSRYNPTRWWSKQEVIKQVMLYFRDTEPFIEENEAICPMLQTKL